MGADSCLGLVKLFSQSGNPASWTDGEVGKVASAFSNVTHHSGFAISQNSFHHFSSLKKMDWQCLFFSLFGRVET